MLGIVKKGISADISRWISTTGATREQLSWQEFHQRNFIPLSATQRGILAGASATLALLDTWRGDMVAALGECTGENALQFMLRQMQSTEEGRYILTHKPRITQTTFPMQTLDRIHENSLGHAYKTFLLENKFSPDDRSPVRYIRDPELAYVMQRYRELHDLWHILNGCDASVLGELAEKQFEYLQTGLPMCHLSVIGGQWALSASDRNILRTVYLPWAAECHRNCSPLFTVYLEQYFDQDLDDVRKKLNIVVSPPRPTSSI
jgi:ubiquinone biosynthesis protein COQ4